MKRIEIVKNEEWNWYNVGQTFNVKDEEGYRQIGVQVYVDGPDVVQHGHYKFL